MCTVVLWLGLCSVLVLLSFFNLSFFVPIPAILIYLCSYVFILYFIVWHAAWGKQFISIVNKYTSCKKMLFLCPRHSKNGGGALRVTPVRPCVRPSVIKIWCPLNNFWKNASIQFKFSMFICNIETQVVFDLGYNPLIFDGVMGLL